jgi:pantetheine-phosphate adenylyltransferase
VFAGTFDPITKGHAFVVEKCLQLFDKVVIAVGVNVDKKPLFSTDERMEIIKSAFADENRVEVKAFSGMLVDFMTENDIKFTVRGLRDADDYKYETTMARYNQDMYGGVTTLFIPTPANLSYVSSSAMRNIINLGADFNEYVPEKAIAKIKELIKNK